MPLLHDTLGKVSFAVDILRIKLTKKYRPLQVQITLTNRCNIECGYCYAQYPNREHKDLTTPQMLKLIDELAILGTRRINLVGGEPLLRKDIALLVDHIKSKKIQVVMTTNGYLIPQKLETVKKLDLLTVSLDGDKESNDKNRAEGCYDKAMEGISLAKQNGIPLQVSCVITKNNLDSILYVLQKGKEIGFSVGFTTLIAQTVDGKKVVPPYMPTDQEYRDIFAKIIGWKEEGYPVLFSKQTLEYTKNWKYGFEIDKIIGKEPEFDYIECNAGKYFALVDVNGDVYPCPVTVDVMKVKNALRDGLGPAFKHINHHPCKTCHIACQNEFSLMYALNPKVIFNILKNYRISRTKTV